MAAAQRTTLSVTFRLPDELSRHPAIRQAGDDIGRSRPYRRKNELLN
jgi:hypothetical protein